jgi:hypothetical protein
MQANDGSIEIPEEICFHDATALFGAGVLTLEQYLFHLLEHFKGARHRLDKLKGDALSRLDPFAASLRTLVFDNEATKIDGKITRHRDSYEH